MPIITISRGFCSGGAELAELLHQRLGWPIVSHDDVSTAATKAYRMTEEELFRGLHLPANFYERFTHRKTRYLLATQATIAEQLPDGNGIYHGLAGQFLLQELDDAFTVRIVAPTEQRVETAMQRKKLSRDEALRHIRVGDDHRAHWGRQIFDADINDPDLYDLVVNLEQVSLSSAANFIAEIMQDDSHRPTPERVQAFDNFALVKRIQAELYFNSPFTPDMTRISVRNGEVFLAGERSTDPNRTKMVEFIGQIPGVTRIHADHEIIEAAEVVLDPASALSSRDARASDVMLGLDQYPNCRLSCTIREAFVALSASSVKLEDGHITIPRYVLIRDDDDNLVGVVSRREVLKGLVPHFREDRESAANIQELVPFGGKTPPELFIRWNSLFSRAALEAAKESIQSIMIDLRGTVQVNDSLSTVISTMLYHGIDLVPVLDGTKVVGVVLMTNIFDIVAQFVMEHGGKPTDATGMGGDDD